MRPSGKTLIGKPNLIDLEAPAGATRGKQKRKPRAAWTT